MRNYLSKCASMQVLAHKYARVRKCTSACASTCASDASAHVRTCASTQVCKYMRWCISAHVLAQVCKCASTQVDRYASAQVHVQVRECSNTQVCKCASVQILAPVHKYARASAQVQNCAATCANACASTCASTCACARKKMFMYLRNSASAQLHMYESPQVLA